MALLLALAVFLAGLRLLAASAARAAGERVRRLLLRAAGRPLLAFLAGLGVTAVIQSSSATAAVAVALVDAGLLPYQGAVAVVLGANVGTTVTVQLAALPLGDLGWPCLGAGLALVLMARAAGEGARPLAHGGEALAGLGGLLLGLAWLGRAVPLAAGPEGPSIVAWFVETAASGGWRSVLAGLVVTALVQSSSATTSLAVVLARSGRLSLEGAVGVALGANVGTVGTTLLAAAGASAPARRTALADLIVNTLGVLAVLPWLETFAGVAALTAADRGRQVANAHLLFNLLTAGAALPCLPALAGLARRLVPGGEGGRNR